MNKRQIEIIKEANKILKRAAESLDRSTRLRAAIEVPKQTCSADYRDTKGRTLSPDKLEIGQVFLMNGMLSKVADIVDGKPVIKLTPTSRDD